MSEVARQARSKRQRWAAAGGSHDRVVAITRVVLPIAIGVLAAFLVMAPLTMSGDVSFVLDKNKVAVAHERLKISAATYRGEDSRGRAFTLTAGSAVQATSAVPVVQIDKLAAQIAMPEGPSTLTAPKGRYDMESESVGIDGPIEYRAADGYSLDTSSATLDLKTRRMQTGGGVTGTIPLGNFSANRMRADLEARTVALDGRARLRIVPNRSNARR